MYFFLKFWGQLWSKKGNECQIMGLVDFLPDGEGGLPSAHRKIPCMQWLFSFSRE